MRQLDILTGKELHENYGIGYKSNFKFFSNHIDTGYIILYHDDFDGLASAALFSLRGAPILSIPKDKCIYHPIQFETSLDFELLESTVKKKLIVDNVWYIFLDFNLKNTESSEFTTGKAFLTIDHHALCPKEGAMIVIHDIESKSCAQLIAKTFPSPNPLENPEAIERVLNAAQILDYGDEIAPEISFKEVLLNPPGCIVFYNVNDKLKTNNALKLLLDYMTIGIDEKQQVLINHFIKLNHKILEYKPLPFKEYTYVYDNKDNYSFGIYTFSNSRVSNLFFAISVFKAHNMLNDFTVLIKKVNNNFYRASVRSKSSSCDVQKFCKHFGGGGKKTRSGGFGFYTDNLRKSIRDMKVFFESEIIHIN